MCSSDLPLVVLDSKAGGADVGELTLRVDGLRAANARLESEVQGAEKPAFGQDLMANHPDLVRQAIVLFEARHNRQHRALYAPLRSRDTDTAVEVVRDHLIAARNQLSVV